MMRDSEPTISFQLSAYLLMVEGPALKLAAFLDMLYAERTIDRATWGVSHRLANRATFAEELRAEGMTNKRLGFSATNAATVDVIQRRAGGLNLKCIVMRAGAQHVPT